MEKKESTMESGINAYPKSFAIINVKKCSVELDVDIGGAKDIGLVV